MVAAFSTTAAADVSGTVTRLSTGSSTSQQNMPVVSGSQVVWTNADTPAGGASNFDQDLYDLSSGAATNLTNTPADQEFLSDIDAGTVVWTHTSAGIAGDIVAYDTAANRVATVASSTDGVRFEQPAIRGGWIAFLRVSAQTDVYLYDYTNGRPVGPLTNDSALQARPRIGGGIVVWEDYSNGNADVMGYTIPSGPVFSIASGPDDQLTPDVDGNTVVYVQHVNGTDQLFAYDIAARTTRQLTTAISTKILPRISGSLVVWSDDRNGTLDIYSYDLATNTEERVVGGAGDQFLPDIDGGRIVYTDNAAGFEQVYLFTIAPPPPPAPVPHGCDPALTDAVGGSLTAVHASTAPVDVTGTFSVTSGRTYWVCIENGLTDGSQRATHAMFKLDNKSIVSTSDFRVNADPPRYIDSQLKVAAGTHTWSASVFGPNAPNQITVTIRVDK